MKYKVTKANECHNHTLTCTEPQSQEGTKDTVRLKPERERGIRRNQPILPDISATFEGHSFKATLGYRVKFKASMGNLVRPYLNTDC